MTEKSYRVRVNQVVHEKIKKIADAEKISMTKLVASMLKLYTSDEIILDKVVGKKYRSLKKIESI